MEKVYKYIIESINKETINKEEGIELINILKNEENKKKDNDIAIIGISCRLPHANNVKEFWNNITNKIDSVSKLPKTRESDAVLHLLNTGVQENEIKFSENGYLEEIDKFDYKFFKLTPTEARLMDPCQRIFLETVWSAIEDAGYGGNRLNGSNTGVYVGYASNLRDLYLKMISESEPSSVASAVVPNLTALIPSRISYLLNLKGPSMVIDTACSSALVSVNLACQAIRKGNCDLAIAGGININTLPFNNEDFKVGIESSDSRSRAFDENSGGSGIGEGVATILLKPLEKAINDNDNIYAVIKGIAMNQDGASIGITAPNPASQTEVIVNAWKDANIDPKTITYIETHGTGTNLGDPIEIKGISDAFAKYTNNKQFCAVSSVKTNIGHLCEAAGIVSLIKAVLALKNKQLPPTNYFNSPNSNIKFEKSAIYVNTKTRKWEPKNIRRCGVSSFGISGTNCHIVVEEAPQLKKSKQIEDKYNLLTFSAKSKTSLLKLIHKYHNFLIDNDEENLSDICYTSNTGRQHYNYRLALIVKNKEELKTKLEQLNLLSDENNNIFYGYFEIITDQRKKVEHGINQYELDNLSIEANKKVNILNASNNDDVNILKELCMLYIQGANFKWEDFYQKKYKKVSLPTYQFDDSRCWLKLADNSSKKSDVPDKFYTIFWNEEVLKKCQQSYQNKKVLVFINKNILGELEEKIIFKLREVCSEVIIVKVGDRFNIAEEKNEYEIKNTEDDYTNLLNTIKSKSITNIVHLMTLVNKENIEKIEELYDAIKRGTYSLFYLTKAIVKSGLDTDIGVSLISRYVYEITKKEKLIPENAPYFGLGKTVIQEYPGIKCRCIDIDEVTTEDEIIDEVFEESKYYIAGYRDGKRYIELFSEINIDNYKDSKIDIKKYGVYIITGGTGGIGLEMAKNFASQNNITLILINRSKLPTREKWNDILEQSDNNKLINKIKNIKAIEKLGSKVELYYADISNLEQMETVFAGIRKDYKEINGVLHCAGVPGDGFIIRKEEKVFNNVINPKIFGTWVLDYLTQNDNLDFFAMFSSGLAILSEPGHGDYTAANSYLDAFAYYRNKKNKKTLSINWASWKEAGMSVEYGFNYDSIFKAIPTAEAIDGYNKVLNKAIPRVFIGEMTNNINFLYLMDNLPFEISEKMAVTINRIKKEAGSKKIEKKQKDRIKQFDKVEIKGKESDDLTDIEKKIAQLYSEVLGYDEINIFDSFFELGGDSVMLNRLHAIIQKEYPGKVKLINLFTYTSIADLSSFISEQIANQQGKKKAIKEDNEETKEYEDLLDSLTKGNITIEEAIQDII